MQHNLICNYLKIINITITRYIWGIICLFPLKQTHTHSLENKIITHQYLSGGILYQCFLSYFVNLLLLSLLSFSLFKMISNLPLDMNILKIHNIPFFGRSHNRKLSKSHLITHFFNFLKVFNSWSTELVFKVLDS